MEIQTIGNAKTVGATAQAASAGGTTGNGDVFAALIAQLLGGTETASAQSGGTAQQTAVSALLQLLQGGNATGQNGQTLAALQAGLTSGGTQQTAAELLQTVTEQDAKKDDGKTAGDLTALMELASLVLLQPQQTQQTAEQASASSNLVSAANAAVNATQSIAAQAQNAVQNPQAAVQAVLQEDDQPAVRQQTATQTEAKPAAAAQTQTEAVSAAVQSAETQTSGGQTENGDTGSQLMQLQNEFREAVSKTKQQLQTAKASDTKELDVDALQAQAVTGRDLTIRYTAAPQATHRTTETVSQQIQTGVTDNLALGKTEFTLRLHPESLGEITVKLTEDAGKTTLQLFTASADTARAINNDLHALREAVRPMAVEVHEAVQQTAQSSSDTGAQSGGTFDFSGQQQQTQQQWTSHTPQQADFAGFVSNPEASESSDEESAAQPQTDGTSALDTYI